MRLFEPDIFSNGVPKWTVASSATADTVHKVLQAIELPEVATICFVERSAALEINSSNFRITTAQGQYVLKRWGGQKTELEIKKTLYMLRWLEEKYKIPVSTALMSSEDPRVLRHDGGLWSLFRFIPGEYYNGRDAQLEVAADMAARLHSALFETPQQWLPDAGPIHFSERDNDVFLQARARIDDWEDIFGPECALVLAENWKTVEAAWVKLRRATPDSGAMQPAHFDLHPHNILMLNHNIVAVLDFDACKLMPPGYALAFAGLKLCRQAVAEFGGELTAAAAGRKFVQTVCEREPRYVSQVKHFSVLAIAEVLRRIGIILRLNLVDSDKTWNHVLPIQIKHIGEAQALFGEL